MVFWVMEMCCPVDWHSVQSILNMDEVYSCEILVPTYQTSTLQMDIVPSSTHGLTRRIFMAVETSN
jgi:hypothetical protein